jgi:hypothetical protein
MAFDRGMTVADYTREKLIPKDPEAVLETLRSKQRKRANDEWFTHPKLRRNQKR